MKEGGGARCDPLEGFARIILQAMGADPERELELVFII